jgi:hypothetical protein
MRVGRAAGTPLAAAGASAVSGEPRPGAGAALADETGASSDGVVVDGVVVAGTDSVGVGSDFQDTVAGSPLGSALGKTVSLPVVGVGRGAGSGSALGGTESDEGVGCGVGCGAGSGSALGGTESDGGGGSVSVGGGSTATGGGVVTTGGGGSTATGGGVVTTGGDVGAGAGSATCFPPFTIGVLFPVVSGCCPVEEGCSFAQASVELRTTKAKRHKTSPTTRARGLWV